MERCGLTPAQRNYLKRFEAGQHASIALGLLLAEAGVLDPASHPLPAYERIINDLYSHSRRRSVHANWRFS